MSASLSEHTRRLVTVSVPALEAHSLAITREMYSRLLSDEAIRDLFNMSHQKDGEQPKALAYAVLAYARHINNPAPLAGMIERIAEKHVGLNILPEHYPYVGKALLGAIAHVLGDAATPEIMKAWEEAYGFLANVLINREGQIYEDHTQQPGGWTGWRSFRIDQKNRESKDCISFILKPVDSKPVMQHKPGQYLSFRLAVPGKGSQRRNYSISSAPASDHYRITVKCQKGGVVSNWLHHDAEVGTVLDVSAPAGDFFLADEAYPLVLLSAGVGLTPMISMMDTAIAKGVHTQRPIYYIHGTHNADTEAFGTVVRSHAEKGHLKADFFYSQGAPEGHTPNVTCHTGHLQESWFTQAIPHDAAVYLCGPSEFMVNMVESLKKADFPAERIRYEMFGSASVPSLVLND